jgi:hypothetical protein
MLCLPTLKKNPGDVHDYKVCSSWALNLPRLDVLQAVIRHVYNTYTRTPNSTTDGCLNKYFLHSRLDLKARMRITVCVTYDDTS